MTVPNKGDVTPKAHEQDTHNFEGKGELLDGRFELLEILGTGKISTVYKSIDWNTPAADRNHYVTVKILQRQFQTNEDFLVFERAIAKYQNLEHPNISRVYGLSQVGTTGFLLMEYLSGQSLGQSIRLLRVRSMPVKQILHIVKQIGQALAYAHDQDLIHGDLKPANIFLTHSGEIKVVDFGLARTLRSTAKDKADVPQYGANNFSASTPSYASPEVLGHRKPDPRDDVYALACITYEILSGQHPFGRVRATGAQEFGLKLNSSDAFTKAQWDSLQKALAFERGKRTATVTEFLAGLDKSGSSLPLSSGIRRVSLVAGIIAFVVFVSFLLVREVTIDEEMSTDRLAEGIEQEEVIQQQSSASQDDKDYLVDIKPEPATAILHSETISKLTVTDEQTSTQLPVIHLQKPESVDDKFVAVPKESPQEKSDIGIAGNEQSLSPAASDRSNREELTQTISPQHIPSQRELDRQMGDLLSLAESQLAARRLSLPAGDNALETYREILSLTPDHYAAKQGILSIKKQYLKWSEAASNQGDWEKAKAFAQKSALIEPQDDAALLAMLQKIEESRQAEQQASRQADKDALNIAKVQTPITRPAAKIARITDVRHELITDRASPVANIQAQISGTVSQAAVFVDSGDGFQSSRLYDDGTHGDQISGDGEYYAAITLGKHRPEIHYYVTAYMDKGVSVSSPFGAEKAAYLITLPHNELQPAVVINEFMASNNKTIADSLGGYDDWIELYNRSQKTIDLSGFYLSNNPRKLKLWKFPQGASIGANSYLIIWADRSSSSTNMTSRPPEFHTNFKLSSKKGQILLVEPDENDNTIIDQISFARQREDLSMGRYPDGYKEFGSARTQPTPGRVNASP